MSREARAISHSGRSSRPSTAGTGLILVVDPGRSIDERDVADVTGLDVVATVPVSPGVARTIDAGLLAARHPSQSEFRDLRRWLTTQLDPFPSHQPPRGATAPTQPEKATTILAVCATHFGVGWCSDDGIDLGR